MTAWSMKFSLLSRRSLTGMSPPMLSMSELYGEYPCHRVVNHAGRPAPHFYDQVDRLREEGVKFLPNGCVDMKTYLWNAEK